MNELNNLALRRNIIFPCNEIYPNSPAGFYDYGPIGLKIKNNLINFWRKEFLEDLNALEIDGCQILPEPIFKASGHLDGFFDPVLKCSKCGLFYRADKFLESKNIVIGEKTPLNEIDSIIKDNNLNCEKCKSHFEKAFHSSLMFDLNIGTNKDKGYLRPEACQNIFLDFLRIYKGSRRNLPLPIAQIGKAFRNEISPRNGIIRGREFTQMDIEVFFDLSEINNFDYSKYLDLELPVYLLNGKDQEFIKIKDLINSKKLNYGVEIYYIIKEYLFFVKMGITKEKMRFKEVSIEDRPFYSLTTWDLEVYIKDLGWVELVANNYRTDHDLKGHQEVSKTKLEVISNDKKVLPHVFEISMGTDRILYSLLANNLEGNDEKLVLKLNEYITPYHLAIFPLVNKDGLDNIAKNIYNLLNKHYSVIYDDKGSIGKRYARVDEIGVRYCLTVDFESKEKNTITIRDSWTTKQEIINISEIEDFLVKKFKN